MKKALTIICALTLSLQGLVTAQEPSDGTEINQVINGVRQGFWRVEGKNGKVDEGTYVDGKKDGMWKSFGIGGVMRSHISYSMGKPKGEATFYDQNGVKSEEGYWNVDHWEGKYVRYNANGNKACDFFYDEKGRRQGRQTYYHENGQVMYEGDWNEGKITGTLVAYDDQGHKILERNYDEDGKFSSAVEIPVNATEEPPRTFTGTGTFTLYNTDGTIDQKGTFVKGEMKDGEKYVYKDGKIVYIEVYVNGEFTKRKY